MIGEEQCSIVRIRLQADQPAIRLKEPVNKSQRLNAEHAEIAEIPQVCFSAVSALNDVFLHTL